MYKYFNDSKIQNLLPELVTKLDVARGLANTAFVITSGFRTPEKNKEVGGVEDSAHLSGKAVDIACVNSARRMRIVVALLRVGFRRIEIAKGHIHVDIDETKPQDIIFLDHD